MEYQRFGDRYEVRMESGDRLFESLTALAEKENIEFAAISGIGGVRFVTVAWFNPQSREYERQDFDEQLELTTLIGNITLKDGKPFLHLHATFARRDLSVIGGHLFEAVARPTMEIWLRRETTAVQRRIDDESGLSLMDLPGRI